MGEFDLHGVGVGSRAIAFWERKRHVDVGTTGFLQYTHQFRLDTSIDRSCVGVVVNMWILVLILHIGGGTMTKTFYYDTQAQCEKSQTNAKTWASYSDSFCVEGFAQ